MFKHLTRNLKLGLTTLTILTAGAGTAFAQPAGFNGVIDPIAVCSNSGGFRGPSYCTTAVVSCINNPFGTGCATTLGTKAHTVAKVRYCGDQDVPSDESKATAHACHDTWGGANAAMWAKQNPDAPDSPDTDRPKNQFLKGTAAGLDTSGIAIYYNYRGALYFDTATFDGKALGGDATDGVAFVTSTSYRYYAGILSGTDLGAPVTQRSGTASWVGQFQAVYDGAGRDFVLEVTFGGGGDKAGSIEAFVKQAYGSRYFHLEGDFDNSGMITNGTVDYGDFTDNDRDNPTGTRGPGTLTGLIGQEGAVGAFHRNDNSGYWYSGGFVARPVNLVTGLSPTFIADTCTGSDGDPFHEFCHIGNLGKGDMDEQRSSRIRQCIHGGSASNDELCENAIDRNPCILNPFDIACVTNDKFATYHVEARANRITFCADPTNSESTLCAGDAVANICGYDPFHAVCFGSGVSYEEQRTTRNKECGVRSRKNDADCNGALSRATSASFLQSFATELNSVPAAADSANLQNEFLKGLDTLADAERTPGYRDESRPYTALNLADVLADGTSLGGDAADGVAFFGSKYNRKYGYHAGILSGTDLGKPLTATTAPTGEWKGIFQATGTHAVAAKDFILTVTFNGGENHVGEIDAFVQHSRADYYHLTGNFDSNGVIKGTVDFGAFKGNDSSEKGEGSRLPGRLRGLIGEQGAVGAFIAGTTSGDSGSYSGGFVARPTPPPTVQFSDWVDSFDDALPTSPSTGGSASNQFLKGGATELISIGVTVFARNSLNLADATFGGNRLGGDSVDGVAFFRGTPSGAGTHYYAGILSGTDLGGPVTQTAGSADWNGSLQIVHGGTVNSQPSAIDFTLTVNFGGTGDRAGSISSTFRPYSTSGNWTLSGHFDTNGVITGNINLGARPPGNVTGLIGQQGAVGAFYAVDGATYSGGFVVDNPDN